MQNRIMKLNEYDDGSSFWRVACDCSEPNHDVNLWFEPNEGMQYVDLNLSMEIGFYGSHRGWFRELKRRIGYAAKILFMGHCTMQGDVILDRDGILAMQTAIQNGIEHMDKVKAVHEAKK